MSKLARKTFGLESISNKVHRVLEIVCNIIQHYFNLQGFHFATYPQTLIDCFQPSTLFQHREDSHTLKRILFPRLEHRMYIIAYIHKYLTLFHIIMCQSLFWRLQHQCVSSTHYSAIKQDSTCNLCIQQLLCNCTILSSRLLNIIRTGWDCHSATKPTANNVFIAMQQTYDLSRVIVLLPEHQRKSIQFPRDTPVLVHSSDSFLGTVE